MLCLLVACPVWCFTLLDGILTLTLKIVFLAMSFIFVGSFVFVAAEESLAGFLSFWYYNASPDGPHLVLYTKSHLSWDAD